MAFTKDATVQPIHLRPAMQPISRFYDGEAKRLAKSESASSIAHCSYRFSRVLIMGFLTLFAAIFFLSTRGLFSGASDWLDSPGHAMSNPFELQKSWGQYSPFFPVKGYEGPPPHCKVTQV
jgi:hypothetical protein